MAEIYKQIKDFTLKNSIDGTEDILIQSNGITMRIKSSQLKTNIDLSNYYTKSEVDNLLANIDVNIDMADYYDKSTIDNLLLNKANVSHTHTSADITDLSIPTVDVNKAYVDSQLANKANTNHTHDEYISETELNEKGYATETYVQTKITEVVTGGTVDLSNYATKTELNEKANANHTHSQYLTAIPSEYITETELNSALSNKANTSDIPSLNGYATESFVTNKIAEASLSGGEVDLSGLATKDELNAKADKVHTHTASQVSGLSTVATSGSYNDLSNKPTIPNIDGYATETYVNNKLGGKSIIYLTQEEYNLLSDTEKQDDTKVYNIINATIDYSEISNTPTIPTKTSQLTNDSGFLTSDNLGVIKLTSPNGTKYKLIVSDDGSLSTELLETILCESISIDANSLTFTTSEPQTLNVSTVPSNTTERIVYSLNPTGIVNINNGVVTPISNGNCIITVTCGSQSATVSVSVSGINNNIPCTSISLNTNTLSFTTSDNQTLTATPVPSNTTDTVLWSVSPEGIVSVSNGIVSPITNGSAVITVTCGSQSATCNVNVNIESGGGESGGGEGSTYVFDCTPQSGTGLVNSIFLFDVNNALSTDTFSLSMDIQPVSNVYGIQNGVFAVNDVETVSDLTNSTNITKNCWVNNNNDSLISLNPTIPTITTDGRYAHVLIKIKPTSTSSKVQFKISNVQFKVNNSIINVSGYGTNVSGDSITVE